MKDFVTFEIAKKLKERGFKDECFYCYRNRDGKLYANPLYGNDCETYITSNELLYSHNSNVSSRIDAPTISQVLKWLRNEKKIHICIDFNGDIPPKWYYQIAIYGSTDIAADGYGYNDYETAVLTGIEYVLDNLI